MQNSFHSTWLEHQQLETLLNFASMTPSKMTHTTSGTFRGTKKGNERIVSRLVYLRVQHDLKCPLIYFKFTTLSEDNIL